MDSVKTYVLTELKLLRNNEVSSKNVGVTTDLAEAEFHANRGVEYGFDTFEVPTKLFVMGAETTTFLTEMRQFKEMVREVESRILGGQ